MKQIQKGFTLIELMIVVAIIGILAAVAIPAYQDYIIKAKLSKVQTTLDSLKTAFALYYQENSGFPNNAPVVVTQALSGVLMPIPPVGTETTWTSIGLKNYPTISKEFTSITYTPGTVPAGGTQAQDFGLDVVLQNIKTTAPLIDTTTVRMQPAGMGTTNLQWSYSCTSTEPLLKKYFKNPDGSDCTAGLVAIP
jgi:type IV pilus assembly protein PilA